MKKYIIILLILLVPGTLVAENLVNSEILYAEDIEKYVMGREPMGEITIQGVFQEGNNAIVYYTTAGKGNYQLKLIRLNSGVWFDPEKRQYVTY